MTTLEEFLDRYRTATTIVVRRPADATGITVQYDTLEITPQFRKQLALMNAFNQYMVCMTEGRLTTDDRIQAMIDHSLGELKFTVNID